MSRKSLYLSVAILLNLVCSNVQLFGQRMYYPSYFHSINQVDSLVEQGEFCRAIEHFRRMESEYDFFFARHSFKAMQIAVMCGDTVSATDWLLRSGNGHVDAWLIRSDSLGTIAYGWLEHQGYAGLDVGAEKRSVNTEWTRAIDSLLIHDQQVTRKVNRRLRLPFNSSEHAWAKNNQRQFDWIDSFSMQHAFPGERLLALPTLVDTAKAISYYQQHGFDFMDHRVYTMLIHYFSDARPHSPERFSGWLDKGYIEPKHYAVLHDFYDRYSGSGTGYCVWFTDLTSCDDPSIDLRRGEIGLPSLEVQRRRRVLGRQTPEGILLE